MANPSTDKSINSRMGALLRRLMQASSSQQVASLALIPIYRAQEPQPRQRR